MSAYYWNTTAPPNFESMPPARTGEARIRVTAKRELRRLGVPVSAEISNQDLVQLYRAIKLLQNS